MRRLQYGKRLQKSISILKKYRKSDFKKPIFFVVYFVERKLIDSFCMKVYLNRILKEINWWRKAFKNPITFIFCPFYQFLFEVNMKIVFQIYFHLLIKIYKGWNKHDNQYHVIVF